MPTKQAYAPLLFFALPIVALLFILASGISAPLILLLYIVIVSEGAGLFLWIFSKIMKDESMPIFYPEPSYKSYFTDKNKAERLYEYVKSAEKKSGEYRRYSRTEIAQVLRSIVSQASNSPELEFLLNPTTEKDKFDYFSTLDHVVSKLESE